MPSQHQREPALDAGNKHHDHYAQQLPPWRNALRNWLIPIVRWETPWLASLQDTLRSPALDAYFACTANLGTHTFYMVFLPIQFWCGYTSVGRASVFMLAAGVYWTGFLKDLLCLPRPLSPPLTRISMSGSAALEYGFPSSHSANAVSVTLYAMHKLRQSMSEDNAGVKVALQTLFCFYALSIIFGRLYCGMHGFLDVVIGSAMGAVITAFQLAYGDWIDSCIFSGSCRDILVATLLVCILVRIHPEPVDDCPCFDDSVSFSGVVIGINLGAWHYIQTGYVFHNDYPSSVPFDLHELGIVKAVLRVLLGVLVIFVWRATMKPTLFTILPPLFRLLEQARLNLPRAFYLNASKYTSIQPFADDDNVIPAASELTHMLKNLAHPRKRSVSVGPQSAADAYETLAYRSRRRRESLSSLDSVVSEESTWSPNLPFKPQNAVLAMKIAECVHGDASRPPVITASRGDSRREKTGMGNLESQEKKVTLTSHNLPLADLPFMDLPAEEENEKRRIFRMVTQPRVRYDVEVVTKLIVYSGIAWIAVAGNPILFETIGLGGGGKGS